MKKSLLMLGALLILIGCDKKNKDPIQGIREPVFIDVSTIHVDRAHTKIHLPEGVVNADWPVAGATTHHTVLPLAINSNLKEAWRVHLGSGSSSTSRLLNGPIIAGQKVFAIDTEGTVSAVDLNNGEIIWQTYILPEKESTQPFGGGVAYADGLVFAVSAAAEVIALDAITGEIRWRQKTMAPVRSAPTVYNHQVYVVTINNQLEVYNADHGDLLWVHSGTIEVAGLLGGASPAIEGNVAIIPYTSGEIFALRTDNGYPLWSESLGSVHALDSVTALSHIKARPVIHKNRVILISHGGRMSAMDMRTGRSVWNKEIAGIRSPAVTGNYIFLITTDNQLIALDDDKGDVLWAKQLPLHQNNDVKSEKILWAGPLLTDQGLVIAGSDGRVLICSIQNGDIKHTLDLESPITLSPIGAQKTLLFLTENAELIAYR